MSEKDIIELQDNYLKLKEKVKNLELENTQIKSKLETNERLISNLKKEKEDLQLINNKLLLSVEYKNPQSTSQSIDNLIKSLK